MPVERDIAAIVTDQSRIRQNMVSLDNTSELFRRYETQLGEQEDQLGKLAALRTQLQSDIEFRSTDFEKFVATLNAQ